MKQAGVVALVAFWVPVTVFGQTAPAEEADTPSVADRLEVRAGSLNPQAIAFVPPPPPKPVPPMAVEAASVVQKPTHTITLLRGEPSTLPDIQRPVAREDQPPVDDTVLPVQRPNFLLGLSVTTYNHSLSHLKWRDPQTQEELEAWCGWDWALVAPMQEISNERVVYHLFFSPWNVDTTMLDPFGRRQALPDHPAVGADQFVITAGSAEAPAGQAFLEAVQRYCIANKPQLEAMRAAREQYRADADAGFWRKDPAQAVSEETTGWDLNGDGNIEGTVTMPAHLFRKNDAVLDIKDNRSIAY